MFLRVLFLLCLFLSAATGAHADIIILKDGRVINGTVLEQDEKKMKIEEGGQVVTYYKDQIQTVNGAPVVLDAPKKEADVIQPQIIEPIQNVDPVIKKTNIKLEKPQPSGLSKRAVIRKFMEVFGTRESMTQNFDRLVGALPPDKAQDVRKILNVDEVIENIMPIYDKYFTQEELEFYIAFYSSEEGKKFMKVLPEIMKESVDVNIDYFKTKLPSDDQK